MKLSICTLALIGAAGLAYALFQPIIEWNFGWRDLPNKNKKITFYGVEDSQYSKAIRSSKIYLDSILKNSGAPSLSIAAMVDGNLVWNYAAGFRDLDQMIPADTGTMYRIGSVSKALTSLGLGKTIESNLIHLDSSVHYYYPSFPQNYKITIRQLASHQSGIRNYGVCMCFPIWEYYQNEEYQSIKHSLYEFENDPLLFDPGESFAYSSFNYTALSYVMERASKRNFLSYMGEYVFSPLQMNNTEADKHKEYENRANPYEVENGQYKNSFPVNLSNKWAGGGFLSTPSDLVRAGNTLLNSSFLKEETIDKLIEPQKLNNGTVNEQNYALGWRHDFSDNYSQNNQEEVIHHGGMAAGGMALLVVFPEYNLVLAMTMNKSGNSGRFELFEYLRPIAVEFLRIIEDMAD